MDLLVQCRFSDYYCLLGLLVVSMNDKSNHAVATLQGFTKGISRLSLLVHLKTRLAALVRLLTFRFPTLKHWLHTSFFLEILVS
jgi:hypothetical protein